MEAALSWPEFRAEGRTSRPMLADLPGHALGLRQQAKPLIQDDFQEKAE
jgi:hypothetical protein